MRFKKIYVEITNICNKNCSFCPTSLRKKHEMTKEEFGIVIDKIKSYTNYVYLHIKGEPLLHSEFSNIIKKCNFAPLWLPEKTYCWPGFAREMR